MAFLRVLLVSSGKKMADFEVDEVELLDLRMAFSLFGLGCEDAVSPQA